ncbi:lysophospholipid acyltransferase family protein [Candidatus Leptofilum sp.]|uniref:lysophospholipid acyltransferase family protein n=1 Tax=Candidatus Leptofilum sp. TaxID=3241576 RepID=UPI003B5BBA70
MTSLSERSLEFQGNALALYHRLLARTVRWQIEGRANLSKAFASERPLLWLFWHEQLSTFVTYAVRFIGGEKFAIVTLGGDPRGNILSSFAATLGATPYGVDMQGNPMEAGRKVLRIIQAMKKGKDSFLAPDGPDGPALEPKAGASYLARKAEAAVIPVGGFTKAGYALRRWDNYLIPFPFARLRLVFGEPIFVSRRDKDDAVTEQIAAALTAVYQQARNEA